MAGNAEKARRKVFGIGLSRTGTTSLSSALVRLGYRTVHYPDPAPLIAGDFDCLEGVDAATDTPVAAFFPLLDQRFPGSRFVLTIREVEAWLDAMEKHVERMGDWPEDSPLMEIRRLVYGRTTFERAHFRGAYERHHSWVRDYFKERPGDLLEIDIVGGAGWEPLCGFLGCGIPGIAFPHRNRRPALESRDRYYTRTIAGPGLPFGRAPGGGGSSA